MNIVILPSWYRSLENPESGVFIRQQAIALARHFPQHRIFISLPAPAQNPLQISLRNPQRWEIFRRHLSSLRDLYHSPKWFIWHFLRLLNGSEVFVYSTPEGYFEVMTPCVTWSERFLQGNARGLLAAHRNNLNYIEAHFGPPDILHVHVTWPAGEIGCQLSLERNIPLLITEHMGPFPFQTRDFLTVSGTLTPLLKRPLEQADAVIAVSASLARRMRELGVKRVDVIPNCVDELLFTPTRQEPSQEFLFVCVGHLCQDKGIDDLLAAFALIVSQLPEGARLQIIGDGDVNYYKQQVFSLGIEKQVDIIGALPHRALPAYLQKAHVFVLPSYHESFGVSYIEALACGKPVIATRCGGPEDFVSEVNGCLIPFGDRHILASTMKHMMQTVDKYDPMKIRQDCLARFSSGSVAQQLMQKYVALLRARKGKQSQP